MSTINIYSGAERLANALTGLPAKDRRVDPSLMPIKDSVGDIGRAEAATNIFLTSFRSALEHRQPQRQDMVTIFKRILIAAREHFVKIVKDTFNLDELVAKLEKGELRIFPAIHETVTIGNSENFYITAEQPKATARMLDHIVLSAKPRFITATGQINPRSEADIELEKLTIPTSAHGNNQDFNLNSEFVDKKVNDTLRKKLHELVSKA